MGKFGADGSGGGRWMDICEQMMTGCGRTLRRE